MSYGVVIHDYMRDMMKREFTFAFGNTADVLINKAYNTLVRRTPEKLMYDDEVAVTRTNFTERLRKTLNGEDGLYIAEPYAIYVSLFKVPEKGA